MAKLERIFYRCTGRYIRCLKHRFLLCLIGIALVIVTIWGIDTAQIDEKSDSLLSPQKILKFIQGDNKKDTRQDSPPPRNGHESGFDGFVDKESQDHFNELQKQFLKGPPALPPHLQIPGENLAEQNNVPHGVENNPPAAPPNVADNNLIPNVQPDINILQNQNNNPLIQPNNQQSNGQGYDIPQVPNLPPNENQMAQTNNQQVDVNGNVNEHAPTQTNNVKPESNVQSNNIPGPLPNNQQANDPPPGQIPNVQQVPNVPGSNSIVLPPGLNLENEKDRKLFEQILKQAQIGQGNSMQQQVPNIPSNNNQNLPPNSQPQQLSQFNNVQQQMPKSPLNIPVPLSQNQQSGDAGTTGQTNNMQPQIPTIPPNNNQLGGISAPGLSQVNVPANNNPLLLPNSQLGGMIRDAFEKRGGEINNTQQPHNVPSNNNLNVPSNNQQIGVNGLPSGNANGQIINMQQQQLLNNPSANNPAAQQNTRTVILNGQLINIPQPVTNAPLNNDPVPAQIGQPVGPTGQFNNLQQQLPNSPLNNNPVPAQIGQPVGPNDQFNNLQQQLPNAPLNNNPIPANQQLLINGQFNNMQQQLPNNPLMNNLVPPNNQQGQLSPGQTGQGQIQGPGNAGTKATVLPVSKEDVPVVIHWNNIGGKEEYDIYCKTRRCHLTPNREVRHQHDIVGIVYYGTDFATDGLPLPRKPGHLWSVIHEESPKNNDWLFCAKGAMELFNLTGTFKRESNYPFPTQWLTDEKDLTSKEYMIPLQKKNELRKEGLAPVVFVHSDCNTPSDRSHYMRLLQQYIKIDSYSQCEHNKEFPRGNMTFDKGMGSMLSPDFFKLLAQYKFAFAFENAVCDDYITEKFWRPLKLGVVPIVHGSPKIKDFTPSDQSIIDIRDFPSVKEVADYITYLDTNDEEYSKFLSYKQTGITNPKLKSEFEKRDFGQAKPYPNQFAGFQCFVCEKLHELKSQILSGQPVQQWQGKHDHYGCPKPKAFDENGKYVIEKTEWNDIYDYASYYLEALRYNLDNSINANHSEIHKLAQTLERKAKKLST